MIERYNPYSRYQHRSRQRFYTFLILMGTFCFAIVVGYWFGQQGAAARLISQKKQIEDFEKSTEMLRNELTEALTKKQEADFRYQSLQAEMEALVPSEGPLRGLLDLLRARLEEGSSPERLSYVIRSAQPPKNCTDPDTKRFVVTTPNYKGPNSSVNLENGAIILTAEGESARAKDGEAEAWYDPGRPVTVTLKRAEGEDIVKTGVLPLSTSLVVKNREYRLTLATDAKSFMKVTYDSCDYP